jgi:hypothetical protein
MPWCSRRYIQRFAANCLGRNQANTIHSHETGDRGYPQYEETTIQIQGPAMMLALLEAVPVVEARWPLFWRIRAPRRIIPKVL